jgi:protoporphyrinogen oxidase
MSKTEGKKAIIIGGGPGGLTAAYEFLQHSDILPIVIEQGNNLGGISQTIDYKGNKIDIGGHRFFSKSDRVMDWWLTILPVEKSQEGFVGISYQNKTKNIFAGESTTSSDLVMLVRNRLSRILFLRKLFDYPLSINLKTMRQLGLFRIVRIGLSYTYINLFPIKNEKTLEDFFINRFGKELYLTFFKAYTEKVWGQNCKDLDASWGAQRIKGLSISKAVLHALKAPFRKDDLSQKKVETSLIERFLYPKFGPGQMWQRVGELVEEKGGIVLMNKKVVAIQNTGEQILSVTLKDITDGKEEVLEGHYFISTMPIKDLMNSFTVVPPPGTKKVSDGLIYRDFMTVGLLLTKLKIKGANGKTLPDTWIYVQESDVKVGRIQFFNNWSPYMVKDPDKIWVGLEYFVNEGDELWEMKDEAMTSLALDEMVKMGFIDRDDCIDSVVIRMPKAYPAYTGSYKDFDVIRAYTDKIENLFLIGRNGMHRYNNQDHSMLTAMLSVENILNGVTTKNNIWDINTEQEYHERK